MKRYIAVFTVSKTFRQMVRGKDKEHVKEQVKEYCSENGSVVEFGTIDQIKKTYAFPKRKRK